MPSGSALCVGYLSHMTSKFARMCANAIGFSLGVGLRLDTIAPHCLANSGDAATFSTLCLLLARAQRRLGGGANGGSVNPGIVARLRSARDHLDVDEHRPLFGQDGADLLLEDLQIGKRVRAAISGRAREAGKIDSAAIGDRMAAVRLVCAVLAHKVNEVARGGLGDRHQGAEVYEQAAVTVENDHPLVRPSEREPEPVRGGQPHRAVRQIVERARSDGEPVERGAVDRQNDVAGVDVARQRLEAIVALHHDATGLRPMSRTTGCELSYASSMAGLILVRSALCSIS